MIFFFFKELYQSLIYKMALILLFMHKAFAGSGGFDRNHVSSPHKNPIFIELSTDGAIEIERHLVFRGQL